MNQLHAEFGKNTKNLLKQVKKLTSAGELVKVANTHNLLTELRHKKAEVAAIAEEKMNKKLKENYK